MSLAELNEFAQVYDLMITPVADVRPRVIGVDDFPVNAFRGDAVRVVAVRGSGIEELGDDRVGVVGVRGAECLPVLEDIAPVALIRDERVALFVTHADVEAVPRT